MLRSEYKTCLDRSFVQSNYSCEYFIYYLYDQSKKNSVYTKKREKKNRIKNVQIKSIWLFDQFYIFRKRFRDALDVHFLPRNIKQKE
jgi:hypothetical protein